MLSKYLDMFLIPNVQDFVTDKPPNCKFFKMSTKTANP